MRPCRLLTITLPLLAVTYLAGCAGTDDTGHNFRLTEEEGTAIAVTSGGPRYTTPLFTYEPILTLHEDPSREESMLFQPRSFILGPDGCYYVPDAGYIWCLDVERLDQHEPGEDWLYHVFDPEGRYLGTTELPTTRPSIAGGLLMTFVEDPDTGEQVGTVFAIRPAVEGLVYPE